MPIKAPQSDPESVAIDALAFLGEDMERLGRFLSITGIEPSTLRAVACDPGFLGSVLDYLAGDEALLLAFVANRRIRPESVAQAAALLNKRPAK